MAKNHSVPVCYKGDLPSLSNESDQGEPHTSLAECIRTAQRWMSGETMPTLENQVDIAEVLDIPLVEVQRRLEAADSHIVEQKPRSPSASKRRVWLKRCCAELDLTYALFASRVGVRPRTVERWVSGDITPSPTNRVDIAAVLNIPLEEIERRFAVDDCHRIVEPGPTLGELATRIARSSDDFIEGWGLKPEYADRVADVIWEALVATARAAPQSFVPTSGSKSTRPMWLVQTPPSQEGTVESSCHETAETKTIETVDRSPPERSSSCRS